MKKICFDPFYGLNYIGFREKRRVNKILKNKSLFRYDGVNMLYESDKVEESLKNMFNEDALLVNNGTSALKLCLLANGIGEGDEVIVPCLSFIATAASCLSVGAIPVFADIDESFTIDPNSIVERITKKTKAVVVVHYQGYSCDMDKILEICKKYNLALIEDCAQAFGSKYNNKLIGTFGNSSAFSFQACKVITCGEGGAVISKVNMDYINRYADNGGYREKDMMPLWNKSFTSFGENFKITDYQSALLSIQLTRLDKIINHQKLIFNSLTEGLNKYNLRKINKCSDIIPMSLCVTFKTKIECDKFIDYMNENGIEFSKRITNFLPKYNTFEKCLSPYKNNFPYKNYKVQTCLKSLNLLNRSAWLVLNSKLSKKEINYIKNKMVSYYEK